MARKALVEQLSDAVESKDIDAVRRILAKRKLDLNELYGDGLGILHVACGTSSVDVVRELVDAGADPELRGAALNLSPLHVAAGDGQPEVLQFLLKRGGDPATPGGSNDNTSLHFAARAGSVGCCEFLLDAGVDVDARCDNGGTPLQLACIEEQEEVVSLLLARGADAARKRDDGGTALHCAAFRGNVAIVKRLLEAGADPSAATDDGDTPLNLADRGGHSQVVALLKKAQAVKHGEPAARTDAVSTSVVLGAALRHGLLRSSSTLDHDLVNYARETSVFLLEQLQKHANPGGIDPTQVSVAFCYAAAKGVEAAWRTRESALRPVKLRYSEDNFVNGSVGAAVPQPVADYINGLVLVVQEIFCDYQDWMVAQLKNPSRPGINVQNEVFAALTTVGLIAQTEARRTKVCQ